MTKSHQKRLIYKERVESMKKTLFGGKIKYERLNNHTINVITPKKLVTYEEGVKTIEKMISQVKKSVK